MATQKNAKNRALIWKITHPERSDIAPSYVIGTMHVRDAKAFGFEALFKAKIAECAVFATEFALNDVSAYRIQAAMTLPEGMSLPSVLGEKLYRKAAKILQKQTGLSISAFDHLKPVALTNLLAERFMSKDRLLSLDETLWEFAEQNGKILRGIETFDEQVAVLQSMSLESQIKGLKDTIAHFSKFRKTLKKMAATYEQADIEKLYKMAKASAKGNRKLLIYNRNARMADTIAELAAENSLCAAIGAGHLWGQKGVLRLLKKKGFTVKPAHETA